MLPVPLLNYGLTLSSLHVTSVIVSDLELSIENPRTKPEMIKSPLLAISGSEDARCIVSSTRRRIAKTSRRTLNQWRAISLDMNSQAASIIAFITQKPKNSRFQEM